MGVSHNRGPASRPGLGTDFRNLRRAAGALCDRRLDVRVRNEHDETATSKDGTSGQMERRNRLDVRD